MELQTNNHSVFALHYHLVMVVKYRRRVLNDTISDRLKDIFENVAENYHITVEEWNHDIDHVHVLFQAHPKSELSKFMFPHIRKFLWKEMFWSRSFCLLTTGGVTMDVIRQYIESQGEKEKHEKEEKR